MLTLLLHGVQEQKTSVTGLLSVDRNFIIVVVVADGQTF